MERPAMRSRQPISVAGEDGGWGGCSGSGRSSGRSGAGAKFLHLQDDIGEKQGEGQAAPDNRFDGVLAESFPAGDTGDEVHLEKNDGNRKAASHPLAMLLDFPIENEGHGDTS